MPGPIPEPRGAKHPGDREAAGPPQDGHRLRGERQDGQDHRRRTRVAGAAPKYGKIIRTTKKVKAHDENGTAGIGDRVSLMETRPLSATKRWRLVEVLERAEVVRVAGKTDDNAHRFGDGRFWSLVDHRSSMSTSEQSSSKRPSAVWARRWSMRVASDHPGTRPAG